MARIVEARKAGATIQEMRQRFGISYALACEISRQYDAQPARGAARCVYPNIARWMVDNGVSLKAFAVMAGMHRHGLSNLLEGRTKRICKPTQRAILAVTGMDYQTAFYREG